MWRQFYKQKGGTLNIKGFYIVIMYQDSVFVTISIIVFKLAELYSKVLLVVEVG